MNLGIVLTPYGHIPGSFPSEITRSYGPSGSYLCPHDPYQHQRGEAGFYSDTHMGGSQLGFQSVPTDMELSHDRPGGGYTWGWIAARNAQSQMMNVPGPWNPPSNHNGYPNAPTAFNVPPQYGFGDTAADLVATQEAHNRRMFQLSMISTIAVAASALLAIFRTGSLIREDRNRRP